MTPFRRAVDRWSGRPFPYERVRTFGDAVLDMSALRRAIALCTLLVGVAASPALHAEVVPPRPWALAFTAVAVASAAAVAVCWWRGPWPSQGVSLAFVAYADLVVGIGALLYADPALGLPVTCLLLLVGLYVTLVHSPRLVLAHSAWSGLVVTVVAVRVVLDLGVPYALSSWTALMAVVAGLPVIVFGAWAPVRQAAWDSMTDQLTGLLDRRGLAAVVNRMRDPAPDRHLVVAVVDLDHFKAVNDRAGHAAGDEALRRVASRLLAARHLTGVVARTGGEEMVAVREVGAGDLDALGQVLLGLVHDPTDPHPVTASIGIARMAPRGVRRGRLADALLHADAAMYVAKRGGRARAVIDDRDPAARPDPPTSPSAPAAAPSLGTPRSASAPSSASA